jgi:RHS repeat-associated protein
MKLASRILFLTAAIVLIPRASSAQVQPGTPPFGSFGGGPDVIDLANLNSHLTVPILNKPGRGTNFTYDLSADTSVWYPVTSGSTKSWHPVLNWGWTAQTAGMTGYASYTTNADSCQDANGNTLPLTDYSFRSYTDSFGISHPFLLVVIGGVGVNRCPGLSGLATATGTAKDGSGISMRVGSTGPSATVTLANGTARVVPLNVATGTGTSTDRNGNQITVSSTGVFTDTLGMTALTVAGSGTPTSPMTFTYGAPSANASYTVKYTALTVQTSFGCSGVTEYGPISNNLVTEIDLPDSSKYIFTYEPTPGVPANVTGRLASVTLPTGGTISYTYTGGGTGHITCTDGSASGLNRQTLDGTWTYSRSPETAAAYVTKVTDPQGNDALIQFQGIYETQRNVYHGAAPAFSTFPIPESTLQTSNLLRETQTCYNTAVTACTNTAVTLPITQRTITIGLSGAASWASAQTCQHIYKYNATGSLTEQDDFDYGVGTPGAPLKKTALTYATLTNITSFRQQVTVSNGAGTIISQTNYNYGDTVTATTGTPQHITPTTSRGNLLSINYYTHGTAFLTKSMTYFDTGKVQTVTDVNGAQTTYAYGACGNSFPTSVAEPLSLSKSMTWNCTGGAQLTSTDENSQVTTTGYTDPDFWRPASATDPTSAVANLTYSGQTQAEASLSFNSGGSSGDAMVTLDGLGRTHVSQVRETPGGTNFDSTQTDYDSLGRPSRITLPYVGTAGQTNSTAPAKTMTYDALNRTLSISDNSGGSRTFSYAQNTAYGTRGPAPTGENTKRRQEQYDALGRLTSVCEITAGTTAAPAGTCAQTVSQTGYWTKYSYDALGRLIGVTQNAQSSNPQTRTYVYDLLGRLTSETDPENGTTTYTYDSANVGVCTITSNGDLIMRTNAAGVSTCNGYDALHRLRSVGHNPAQANNTPDKFFVFDSATVNGVVMAHTAGRLAEAYTCMNPCTKITDEGFSYTVRGEISDVYESTLHSGTPYYHVSAQYWANHSPKQLTAPGIPTITFTPDGEGRPHQVSAASGQNPVTNTVFNAASQPTSVTYGSSDSDSFTYDPNTNRITQYKFTVNSQTDVGTLTWNANHTLQSLNITDAFNSADTQNCAFTHDDLSRLTSANCGAIWSQTFSYDAFGNISKSGTSQFLPIYKDTSGNTSNRFVSIPGTTVSYDVNGNVLSDGSHTYTWDSDNKPLVVDSVGVTYDAFGRPVEQNRSGAYTQIVYSPGGAKVAIMSGQTLQKGLVPLPGGGVAVYNSSGLLYYGHSDHLGSIRLGSTPTRTVSFDIAYAPFGETYATSGTTDPSFTGQRQDTVAGLFDFPDRQYSTQGRWPTSDPLGLGSLHLSDPQTLNRYAYVRNNPLVMIDPFGLEGEDSSDPDDDLGSGGGGGGGGGGGAGGGGSQDPTSGGDQSNSGGNCPPDDPLCGQTPGQQDPPALLPTPQQPYPAGLVAVDFGTVAMPDDPRDYPYGGAVSVTYQLVDQYGNAMPLEGMPIQSNTANTGEYLGYTTDSSGQFTAQPFAGTLSQQSFYTMAGTSMNPNPIEAVTWSFTPGGISASPNGPSVATGSTFTLNGVNSLGNQNTSKSGPVP